MHSVEKLLQIYNRDELESVYKKTSLLLQVEALEHVVAQLGQATSLENAAKGPLRHPLVSVDSPSQMKHVRQLAAAKRRAARRKSPVVSRAGDERLIRTLQRVLAQAGPPAKAPRRGFFN